MRTLFIYYQLQFDQAAAALHFESEVRAMQRDLQSRHPGLRACLFKRLEDLSDTLTWMETYALVDGHQGVSAQLEQDLQTAACALFRQWPAVLRHTEVFVSCV